MAITPSHREFLGYSVTNYSSSADQLQGQTHLDGQLVSHLLSRGIRRENACDVGRDEHNELVWIHSDNPEKTVSQQPLLFSTGFFPPPSYEPESHLQPTPVTLEKDGNSAVWSVRRMGEWLSRYRKKVIFVAGVTTVATVMGLFFLGSSPQDQEEVPANVSGGNTEIATASQEAKIDTSQEPEIAAIDFVFAGEVEGITIENGLSRDELTAHIVSRSGEIVLVEVQRNQAGNLTTFATLLLQKSGATWRIRQVYDPR